MVVHRIGIGFVKPGDPLIFTQYRAMKSLDPVSHVTDSFWAMFRDHKAEFVLV
jgi:hypothetical protein